MSRNTKYFTVTHRTNVAVIYIVGTNLLIKPIKPVILRHDTKVNCNLFLQYVVQRIFSSCFYEIRQLFITASDVCAATWAEWSTIDTVPVLDASG